MATTDPESIEMFMTITGSSELVAIQKLRENGGNINEAVNSYFTEGDTNTIHETNTPAPQEDLMDIDETSEISTRRPPFSAFSLERERNLLFPTLDPDLNSSESQSRSSFPETASRINTFPENVRETPNPFSTDDNTSPSHITSHPEVLSKQDEDVLGGISLNNTLVTPSAPEISNLPDYGIEEEMIQAAIEASKREAEIDQPDDSVEHEKLLRESGYEAGPSETRASKTSGVEEVGTLKGRLENGSSSIQDETEDADEQPLVRHRSRQMDSGPTPHQNVNNLVDSENDIPSDEWGGMSSEEHEEAVMLEAAMFGGVPLGSGYRVPYTRRRYMRNGLGRTGGHGPYTRSTPRPPSPSLTAQRLIREQQDDEYLASLQADREKELLEQAAKEAAMEEERKKEEDAQRKLEQEQEIERQLAAKEASLPEEPSSDDDSAVALLVRMPDGSRRGRRFHMTDKLQCLFDFIDVGRVLKPSTYRLVRPYPRRAFGNEESDLTLNELGLTNKQEALFLELI